MATVDNMTLKEREKEHILFVLHKTHWDLEKAAHVLRIPLSECLQKLKAHDLEDVKAQQCPDTNHRSEEAGS